MGLLGKTFKTIIMDSSDLNVMYEIIGIIEMMIHQRMDKMLGWHALDCNHPTITVIETRTDEDTYEEIRDVIECVYPGLCVFNPVM